MDYLIENNDRGMISGVVETTSEHNHRGNRYTRAEQPLLAVPSEYAGVRAGSYRRVRTLNSIPAGVLNADPQSWFDLSILPPLDPRQIIADARLGGFTGTFARSTTFLASTWTPNVTTFSGSVTVNAYEADNLLKVEEAAQWTLAHQGGNFNTTVAPPLRRVIFLRGGREWKNLLTFNLGGAVITDVQLSFRDNAASSGNFTGGAAGSVPVIQWTGPFAANLDFELAIKQYGRFNMAVKLTDNLGNHSMFEMEWIVVH